MSGVQNEKLFESVVAERLDVSFGESLIEAYRWAKYVSTLGVLVARELALGSMEFRDMEKCTVRSDGDAKYLRVLG